MKLIGRPYGWLFWSHIWSQEMKLNVNIDKNTKKLIN